MLVWVHAESSDSIDATFFLLSFLGFPLVDLPFWLLWRSASVLLALVTDGTFASLLAAGCLFSLAGASGLLFSLGCRGLGGCQLQLGGSLGRLSRL